MSTEVSCTVGIQLMWTVDDELLPGDPVLYNRLPFTVLCKDGTETYSLRWAEGGAHAPGVLRRLITRVEEKRCT